ncbi:hypothetical protein DYB30_014061 [Aphanomyces astaci]|uniref:Beta-lactamase-related domain-containing protein n=1 Tax=Aphanomyces astaci TaxID=112090 RepID=A0A397E8P7_APHAT|nr:hypothetical protein DYB30_014061 [Aphanomyces astaci]
MQPVSPVALALAMLSVWLFTSQAVAASSPPHPTGRSVADNARLAIAFVQSQMALYPIPGMGLSVVYENETVLSYGFGTKEFGNANAPVTSDTMFQIGSFSKTFIAMGIAKLVDEGRMNWTDTVKTHLPWFKLYDKYAEQHTTLADLLAMNSVFGDHEGDVPFMIGVFETEREMVQRLADLPTSRRLRPGYAYSNVNYAILGQVLEAATNQTWEAYLNQTIWQPLGMTSTVGRVASLPTHQLAQLSSGHLFCKHHVAGPFNLVNDSSIYMTTDNSYIAAGSIITSIADISKFSAFLLRKGRGVFSANSRVVADMLTGHSISTSLGGPGSPVYMYDDVRARSGNVWGVGYGFDLVGPAMFGHRYFDKGGDTITFKTRNGWMPERELGVVVVANAQRMGGDAAAGTAVDRIAAYVLGLFMNEPVEGLDARLQRALDIVHARRAPVPPTPVCDVHVFQGVPMEEDVGNQPTSLDDVRDVVGTYVAPFYGRVTVTWQDEKLTMQYGQYAGRLLATETKGVYTWAARTFLADAPVEWSSTNHSRVIEFAGATFVSE